MCYKIVNTCFNCVKDCYSCIIFFVRKLILCVPLVKIITGGYGKEA